MPLSRTSHADPTSVEDARCAAVDGLYDAIWRYRACVRIFDKNLSNIGKVINNRYHDHSICRELGAIPFGFVMLMMAESVMVRRVVWYAIVRS